MGYLKSLGTTFIYISTLLAIITFIPGLPPHVEFTPYEFKASAQLSQSPNEGLNGAEKLFEGEIRGPEAFDFFDGVLYTTLHGGFVKKLVGNKFVDVVKFGQPCDGDWNEQTCGRPLGLKFDKQGRLYVVDAYYGIFRVDVKTGTYEKIIDTSVPIEGKIPMLPNSIDVASNGDLYWTDSSTDYGLNDGLIVSMCNPSGRLIRYNAATKQNVVLMRNLAFANGVALSDDESFVLVAETLASRLIKYNLKGPRAGTSETFIEALPGGPDNIDKDGKGNFLVSLFMSTDEEHPQLSQMLAPHPNIRKMIARSILLLEKPFKLLDQFYPNYYAKRIIHWIGHFESVSTFLNLDASVLRIDSSGKIMDVLVATDEKISAISSAVPFNDYLYLGSPHNLYIARVPLEKTLPDLKNNFINQPPVMHHAPPPEVQLPPVPKPVEIPQNFESSSLPPAPMPAPTIAAPPAPAPINIAPPASVPTVAAPPPPPTPIVVPPSSSPPAPPVQASTIMNEQIKPPTVPKPAVVPELKPVITKPVQNPQVVPQPQKPIIRDEM